MPTARHPENLPSQSPRQLTGPCRYKLVSEVGSVHSDSVSQNRREAATALASMRGPLIDLRPSHVDRNVSDYRSPFGEDVPIWETADALHHQRKSRQNNYSDDLLQVTAPVASNGDSTSNVNQLTQMMSHLCHSMEAFAQVLKMEAHHLLSQFLLSR